MNNVLNSPIYSNYVVLASYCVIVTIMVSHVSYWLNSAFKQCVVIHRRWASLLVILRQARKWIFCGLIIKAVLNLTLELLSCWSNLSVCNIKLFLPRKNENHVVKCASTTTVFPHLTSSTDNFRSAPSHTHYNMKHIGTCCTK